MKKTLYFKTTTEVEEYYPNGVPSNVIAIVGEGSNVFISSDNENLKNQKFFNADLTNDEIVAEQVADAEQQGYDTGHAEGYSEGETAGYETGHAAGYTEGETAGYNTGHAAGYTEGEAAGYDQGYAEGEANGATPYNKQYLTFRYNTEDGYNDPEHATGNETFTIKYTAPIEGQSNYGTHYYYKHNSGDWTEITQNVVLTVAEGDTIKLKGESPTLNIDLPYYEHNTVVRFESDVYWDVEGNAMSMLFGDNFDENSDLDPNENGYAFFGLFKEFDTLVNAKNLVLQALTLTEECYGAMFVDCTELTTAPVLPAPNVEIWCYDSMFYGCSALVEAPELPALVMKNGCYYSMFEDCTSLVKAPELPAITLADKCYQYMFAGCTALQNIPRLEATTIPDTAYSDMFSNCDQFTDLPPLTISSIESDMFGFTWGSASDTRSKYIFINLLNSDYIIKSLNGQDLSIYDKINDSTVGYGIVQFQGASNHLNLIVPPSVEIDQSVLNMSNVTIIRYTLGSGANYEYSQDYYDRQMAYNNGHTAGETSGYNTGYTAGETSGYNTGYTAGETAGEATGYQNGYTAGETAGYNSGYADGQAAGGANWIDVLYLDEKAKAETYLGITGTWPGEGQGGGFQKYNYHNGVPYDGALGLVQGLQTNKTLMKLIKITKDANDNSIVTSQAFNFNYDGTNIGGISLDGTTYYNKLCFWSTVTLAAGDEVILDCAAQIDYQGTTLALGLFGGSDANSSDPTTYKCETAGTYSFVMTIDPPQVQNGSATLTISTMFNYEGSATVPAIAVPTGEASATPIYTDQQKFAISSGDMMSKGSLNNINYGVLAPSFGFDPSIWTSLTQMSSDNYAVLYKWSGSTMTTLPFYSNYDEEVGASPVSINVGTQDELEIQDSLVYATATLAAGDKICVGFYVSDEYSKSGQLSGITSASSLYTIQTAGDYIIVIYTAGYDDETGEALPPTTVVSSNQYSASGTMLPMQPVQS